MKHTICWAAKGAALLKHIAAFTDTVADAAATYAPNKICNYVQKLAQYFHSFYGAHKILGNDDAELTNQRLALLQATKSRWQTPLTSLA